MKIEDQQAETNHIVRREKGEKYGSIGCKAFVLHFLIGDGIVLHIWAQVPSTPETREGWPLLTVETEGLLEYRTCMYKRGPSLVGSLGSLCQYDRFLSCLVWSSQSSTKYYFPHCFTLLVPFSQQLGKAVVLGRLSLCLCFQHSKNEEKFYPDKFTKNLPLWRDDIK